MSEDLKKYEAQDKSKKRKKADKECCLSDACDDCCSCDDGCCCHCDLDCCSCVSCDCCECC